MELLEPIVNSPTSPLLHDRNYVYLSGGQGSILSQSLHYRRADFAYRYKMLLLNRRPLFHPDPGMRDNDIDAFIKELG